MFSAISQYPHTGTISSKLCFFLIFHKNWLSSTYNFLVFKLNSGKGSQVSIHFNIMFFFTFFFLIQLTKKPETTCPFFYRHVFNPEWKKEKKREKEKK